MSQNGWVKSTERSPPSQSPSRREQVNGGLCEGAKFGTFTGPTLGNGDSFTDLPGLWAQSESSFERRLSSDSFGYWN